MKNESNLNPLTANIPYHVETSLLICIALQMKIKSGIKFRIHAEN